MDSLSFEVEKWCGAQGGQGAPIGGQGAPIGGQGAPIGGQGAPFGGQGAPSGAKGLLWGPRGSGVVPLFGAITQLLEIVPPLGLSRSPWKFCPLWGSHETPGNSATFGALTQPLEILPSAHPLWGSHGAPGSFAPCWARTKLLEVSPPVRLSRSRWGWFPLLKNEAPPESCHCGAWVTNPEHGSPTRGG